MIKSLQHRTTIRRYKDKDVSEELLNGLLEQAMRTKPWVTYSFIAWW